MKRGVRVAVAIGVGLVGFGAVTVGVTSVLESRIAFSLLVGLPMGLYAGVTALFAAYVGLAARDQRRTGGSTPAMRRRVAAVVATVGTYVVVAVAGFGVFYLFDASIGIGLLTAGLPVLLVLAAIAGNALGCVGAR